MTKKQRVGKNAQRTTVYLSPAATVALKQIEALRQDRGEGGDSPSEVIADAIWYFLEKIENIPREEIEKRFPKKQDGPRKLNVAPIRKEGDKVD